nr:bifunctional DNA-formamidopyrimidine glycosylase/DNA-(apurinic or apyrimidinic site) lyase [Zhihengliuella flava]
MPEAEVVRRGLDAWVRGRTVTGVEVLDARSVRRHDGGAADFTSRLAGARVTAVARRGKFMWMPIARPGETMPSSALVAHLGMSGQLLLQDHELPDPRHLRVRIGLSEAAGMPAELRFVDQRIFGGLRLDPLISTGDGLPGGFGAEDPLIPVSAHHIARDVLDPVWTPRGFHRAVTQSAGGRPRMTGIKRAILDQGLISGVGNIYADEALWHARLHYEKPAHTLRPKQSEDLLEALIEVMERSLEEGGTSFDSLYVNVNGESGYFSRSLQAYGRAGQACGRCGRLIVREPFMGRSSYRCPHCQRRRRLQRSHS